MSQAPHDASSFREGRRPVISPDVAEVGGEEGAGLPRGSSLCYLVERSVHSPSCLKAPKRHILGLTHDLGSFDGESSFKPQFPGTAASTG